MFELASRLVGIYKTSSMTKSRECTRRVARMPLSDLKANLSSSDDREQRHPADGSATARATRLANTAFRAAKSAPRRGAADAWSIVQDGHAFLCCELFACIVRHGDSSCGEEQCAAAGVMYRITCFVELVLLRRFALQSLVPSFDSSRNDTFLLVL